MPIFIVANLVADLGASGGGMVSATPSGVNPATSGANAGGVSINTTSGTAYVGMFGIAATGSDRVLTRTQDFLISATVHTSDLILQVVNGLTMANSPYFGVAIVTDGVLSARQTFQINVGP